MILCRLRRRLALRVEFKASEAALQPGLVAVSDDLYRASRRRLLFATTNGVMYGNRLLAFTIANRRDLERVAGRFLA